jgi:hypothetical protein
MRTPRVACFGKYTEVLIVSLSHLPCVASEILPPFQIAVKIHNFYYARRHNVYLDA